jgi:hypothetical protein
MLIQDTHAIEVMTSQIVTDLENQTKAYNKNIQDLETYKNRSIQLRTADPNLIILINQLSQIEELIKILGDDSDINTSLIFTKRYISSLITSITDSILKKEFNLIDVNIWKYRDYIKSKLYTSNFDDFDTLSKNIIESVKNKFEIYC